MFDEQTRQFLESGCALIIGTVSDDGEPHAGRGWGLDVLAGDETMVRLLLDADDATSIAHAAAGGAIAITATSVATLHSLQLKGRSLRVEPVSPEDAERGARFCDDFFTDIVNSDQTDRALVERLTPAGYVACVAVIREVFDQTPGPKAGAAVRAAER